jgi:DNA-directed RNA polymerase subunit E"
VKEQACKKCHRVVGKAKVCPACRGISFSADWKGYVVVRDPENSQIARALKITQEGSYALRVR